MGTPVTIYGAACANLPDFVSLYWLATATSYLLDGPPPQSGSAPDRSSLGRRGAEGGATSADSVEQHLGGGLSTEIRHSWPGLSSRPDVFRFALTAMFFRKQRLLALILYKYTFWAPTESKTWTSHQPVLVLQYKLSRNVPIRCTNNIKCLPCCENRPRSRRAAGRTWPRPGGRRGGRGARPLLRSL